MSSFIKHFSLLNIFAWGWWFFSFDCCLGWCWRFICDKYYERIWPTMLPWNIPVWSTLAMVGILCLMANLAAAAAANILGLGPNPGLTMPGLALNLTGELGLNWEGLRGEKLPLKSKGDLHEKCCCQWHQKIIYLWGKPGGRAGLGGGDPLGPMFGDPDLRCRGGPEWGVADLRCRGGPPGGGLKLGGRWRGVIRMRPCVGLGDLKRW